MFQRSIWLKNYGLIPKIIFVVLFFALLGGWKIFITAPKQPCYNDKLQDWNTPPASQGQKFEDWQKRKQRAQNEVDKIITAAQAKGKDYREFDYFQDFNKMMDVEDRFGIYLTAPFNGFMSKLIPLRDQCGLLTPNCPSRPRTDEEDKYIAGMQERIRNRSFRPNPASAHQPVFWQLLKKYFLLVFFWFLIYLIRFQEKEVAIHRFQRHHHELNRFIDAEEPYPGSLSLREELLLCPGRFLKRILLWPFFCWKYPVYETTAEMVRFNRLKAEYLRYKPVGYQLSDSEKIFLRVKAKAPVEDFENAIKGIKELHITPLIVRKSLATAYLSLALGVLFQPAIVLASSYSEKINVHFYGQIQIIEVGHETQFFDTNSADPPDDNKSSWVILATKFEPANQILIWQLVDVYILEKALEVYTEIFHIPLTRLFLGAAEVFKPLTA